MSKEKHGQVALGIMLFLVLGLMQATHYTKASHLMGAFIAGLAFCTDHDLHVTFVSQFKRVLQVRKKSNTLFDIYISLYPLILSFPCMFL
jgi:Kef-type K+ transport system membrane component KefB